MLVVSFGCLITLGCGDINTKSTTTTPPPKEAGNSTRSVNSTIPATSTAPSNLKQSKIDQQNAKDLKLKVVAEQSEAARLARVREKELMAEKARQARTFRKINRLIRNGLALVMVRGQVTDQPTMSLIIRRSEWIRFSQGERSLTREFLLDQIERAKKNPAKYVDIPQDAPLYESFMGQMGNLTPQVILADSGSYQNLEISEEASDF